MRLWALLLSFVVYWSWPMQIGVNDRPSDWPDVDQASGWARARSAVACRRSIGRRGRAMVEPVLLALSRYEVSESWSQVRPIIGMQPSCCELSAARATTKQTDSLGRGRTTWCQVMSPSFSFSFRISLPLSAESYGVGRALHILGSACWLLHGAMKMASSAYTT